MITRKENQKLIWIAIISSFILLFFAFRFYVSELPNKNNIVKINGILKNDIKIEKGRRGNRTLIIKLINYPEINFTIRSVSLRRSNSQKLIDENKSGDSITLFIEKKEYQRKILKTEKIPFAQKYFHSDKISILEVRNRKSNYLLLSDYNKAHLENNYLAIAFFGFFGLLMAYLSLKGIQYQNKNFKQKTCR